MVTINLLDDGDDDDDANTNGNNNNVIATDNATGRGRSDVIDLTSTIMNNSIVNNSSITTSSSNAVVIARRKRRKQNHNINNKYNSDKDSDNQRENNYNNNNDEIQFMGYGQGNDNGNSNGQGNDNGNSNSNNDRRDMNFIDSTNDYRRRQRQLWQQSQSQAVSGTGTGAASTATAAVAAIKVNMDYRFAGPDTTGNNRMSQHDISELETQVNNHMLRHQQQQQQQQQASSNDPRKRKRSSSSKKKKPPSPPSKPMEKGKSLMVHVTGFDALEMYYPHLKAAERTTVLSQLLVVAVTVTVPTTNTRSKHKQKTFLTKKKINDWRVDYEKNNSNKQSLWSMVSSFADYLILKSKNNNSNKHNNNEDAKITASTPTPSPTTTGDDRPDKKSVKKCFGGQYYKGDTNKFDHDLDDDDHFFAPRAFPKSPVGDQKKPAKSTKKGKECNHKNHKNKVDDQDDLVSLIWNCSNNHNNNTDVEDDNINNRNQKKKGSPATTVKQSDTLFPAVTDVDKGGVTTNTNDSNTNTNTNGSIGPLNSEVIDTLHTYFQAYVTRHKHQSMLDAIEPIDDDEDENKNDNAAITCSICSEGYELIDTVPCSGEQNIHFFCKKCFVSYVTVTVASTVQSVCCPIPTCKSLFSVLDTKLNVSRWDALRIEHRENTRNRRVALAGGECVLHCECGAVAIIAKQDMGNGRISCPNSEGGCTKKYCCKCGNEDHVSNECPPPVETIQWLDKHSKECPNCKHRIEKSGGCDHMTCAISGGGCGHQFWWTCGCPYQGGHVAGCQRPGERNF